MGSITPQGVDFVAKHNQHDCGIHPISEPYVLIASAKLTFRYWILE